MAAMASVEVKSLVKVKVEESVEANVLVELKLEQSLKTKLEVSLEVEVDAVSQEIIEPMGETCVIDLRADEKSEKDEVR